MVSRKTHPKSLSFEERDFENCTISPLPLKGKGLGDEFFLELIFFTHPLQVADNNLKEEFRFSRIEVLRCGLSPEAIQRIAVY
jgi:hypothetical protein